MRSKSPWSVGVVTSYSPVIYSDTGSKTVVMPVIGYEGKHLFLRGLTAGVRLYPIGSSNNLIFKLQFDPRTLQPENLITFKYSNLMSEKSSVLGGIRAI
ncbi:MAG: MipA/OmpV family protein [Gammaproteobacteria bacterium]|nr:MipA/OmpV family protein [Gammaproteobacteria bacterium]